MHDFQEQCQVHGQQCLKINCDRCDNAFVIIFFKTMYHKTLLDSVFVISGIIKVSVSVISLSLRLWLVTLTSTLIIPDITKNSSNNCLKFVMIRVAMTLELSWQQNDALTYYTCSNFSHSWELF